MESEHDAGKGRVVVITGASAGVGRATARTFAREGARLALIARGRDRLESTRKEIEDLGGEATVFPGDVSTHGFLAMVAREVEERLGPIDIWINNAMASVFSPVKMLQPEEVARVTEVTYLGYVYGTLAALHYMLPRDRGTIVQVGSALAYRGIPLQAPYCGAKHAVQGFTESLRTELLHDGSRVRVTIVQLGAMNTPQFGWVKSRLPNKPRPVPPVYQPEVAAHAIAWAARHHRSELEVGESTVLAVAANKMAPGLVDRYLAWAGYRAQQTRERDDPARPDNLWEPAPGDPGAHGTFGHQAAVFSEQLWATTHRKTLAAAGLGVLAGASIAALRRRSAGRRG
ncbi:MAG: SDR family oxidoreductase [Acidiferrobacteraceae bacterium]